ncbi:MAG: hypothetical protein M0T85_07410 [Dehalococcoidales bacterium]|nr:hypothetical protein [Dehalococcoidales bacterium]
MNKVRLAADYICVVDGTRQGKPQQAGIAITQESGFPRLKSDSGRLFLLAEPDLPDGIEAGPLTARWISAEFNADPSASITSRITRAIQSAHWRLRRENAKALSSDRRSASIGLLAARSQDLYLTQLGPCLIIRMRDGEFTLLGEPPPPKSTSFASVLGQDCEIQVKLSREALKQGDVLLICSPALVKVCTSGEELVRALTGIDAKDIADRLFHMHQTSLNPKDFSAVVVKETSAQPEALEDEECDQEQRPRAGRSGTGGPRASATTRASRYDRHPAAPRHIANREAYEDVSEDVSVRPTRSPGRNRAEASAMPPGNTRPLAGRRGWAEEDGPGEEALDRHRRRRRARGSTPGVFSRIADSIRQRGLDPKRVIFAIALPIVLLAIVSSCTILAVRGFQSKAQEEQASSALQKAEQREQDALATEDVGLKRRLLAQADDLASQAANLRSDDKSVAAVRQRIRGELDQLSSVARSTSATRLVDLGQDARDSNPVKMLIQGIDVYILDKGGDRIYKYLLDQSGTRLESTSNPVIARRGDKIGSAVVNSIVTMAWVPAGGARTNSALVFFDDKGTAFQYDPAKGMSTLKIVGLPARIQDAEGYAGSVYMLNPAQKQLIWYLSTPSGYDKAPYDYLNPEVTTDLSTAVDFAIEANLYLLHSTGKIERFYAGRPQPFEGSVPDTPLKAPAAIYSSQATSSVYVVDRGNERVVQFSKDGRFERQFRSSGGDNIFENLKSISVDEGKRKLYALSGSKVFVTDIEK